MQRQPQLVHQQRTSQVEELPLVIAGMVNRSFLIFFARLMMFIAKLDRQLIRKISRLIFSFQEQNTVDWQRYEYASPK